MMARLTLVELRKMVDTRAGRWLLGVVGGLVVAAVLAQLVFSARTVGAALVVAQWPVSVVLPVMALLSVTSEFSSRTALATFALVPRRGSVVLAKASAAVLLCLAGTVFATIVALVAAAVVAADWSGPSVVVLSQLALVNVATMLCGWAFGLLLLHTAPAIVTYYVVPIAWTVAGQLVPALGRFAGWVDIGQSRVPLTAAGVTGREWAMFAMSCLLWVMVPALAGVARVHRTDLT